MDNFKDRIERAASSLGFLTTELPKTSSTSAANAITFLVEQLVIGGLVPPDKKDAVVRTVLARESLGSTAIGHGLAIPHAAVSSVSRVAGILSTCQAGLSWEGASDGRPVHFVCLILTPVDRPGDDLRALERLNEAIRLG